LHRDLCGSALDLTEIVGREFECNCSDVLAEPLQPSGARNWNNPWPLGEQPGESYLSRCRPLPLCDPPEQINQGLIRLPSILA